MNILVVNYRDRMHPAAGGAEKHLHRIFSLIAEAGHQVVLLTTAFAGCKEREVVDGIQVVRKGGDLLFQLTVAMNIRKLDREFNFDVVVEDLNKLPLFTPFLIKKPVLVQMHHLWRGSIFHEAAFPVAAVVWAFETVIPWFYRKQPFVVVSPSTKRELEEIGIDEDRISVIYNGSDNDDPIKMEPGSDEAPGAFDAAPVEEESSVPYFLWLSRVHRYKGIWTALQAFEEFAESHPDVKLVVAGDGPLLKKIPAWLKERGLEEHVELLGFVSSEKKKKLLENAVALLQTSFKEGWGLTVVEAAKLGTTTIASDVPGLRDSVRNGETGLLFPVGDAHTCAMEMDRIYSDDDLRTRLSHAAKSYADEFRWDTAAEKTLDLLQDAVIERQVGGVSKINPRLKSALIFCLKLVVTIVPAYFVYRNIVMAPDWSVDDLYRLFSTHSIWPLFVALLCLGLSNFTACLQWKLLLEKQNVKLGYGHLLKLYYVGLFFNNFMPGNVGGDAKKIYDIRMQGGQDTVGAGLTATFFDRLYGLFFITLFALAMGLLFFMHDEAQRSFMWPSVWIFLGFCALFAALCSRRLGRLLCKILTKVFPKKINTRLIHMFERFQHFRSVKLFASINLLSAVTQGLRILVHYFCGIAVGVDLSISWYFYYIPLVAIVSALPISIGGFGPRELLAQSLFARAGVPGLESVVIQLLAYFVSLVLSLFGAFVFLLGGNPVAKTGATEPK